MPVEILQLVIANAPASAAIVLRPKALERHALVGRGVIRDGHTPSIRIMQERIEAVAPKAPRRKQDADVELKKPDALGKKEQQVLAAQKMPDDYGDIFARRGKRDS